MIHFGKISEKEFLSNYWQKKPLLIKQALPGFISPVAPDELAGLSLEEEFESRLITGSINDQQWSLTNGPFDGDTFNNLPDKNWTLLVQGVDRFIPEVEELITHFDFIPRWRFDDVMISYAATGGSVGPHFDFYDVFLLQGSGKRRWHLSTQHCNTNNYLENVPLRIMNQFTSEQVFDVEPGDILYIPPKVAHHGVSLDDDCTTLSFGYRSYSAKEMFGDNCPINKIDNYYQDPIWNNNQTPASIPNSAVESANKVSAISAIDFAKFVTKLDTLDQQILQNTEFDLQYETFNNNTTYQLHPVCKIAYLSFNDSTLVFINGEQFEYNPAHTQDLINFCNTRSIESSINTELSQQLFKLNLTQEK